MSPRTKSPASTWLGRGVAHGTWRCDASSQATEREREREAGLQVPNSTPPEHLPDRGVARQRARDDHASRLRVVRRGLLDHHAERHAHVDLHARLGLGAKLGLGVGRRSLIAALAQSRSRSRSRSARARALALDLHEYGAGQQRREDDARLALWLAIFAQIHRQAHLVSYSSDGP